MTNSLTRHCAARAIRRPLRVFGILVAALSVSCGGPEAPVGETLTQEFWPTETYGSEAGSTKDVILSSYQAGKLDATAVASFLPDFRAEGFAARARQAPRVGSGVSLADWLETPSELDGAGFRRRLERLPLRVRRDPLHRGAHLGGAAAARSGRRARDRDQGSDLGAGPAGRRPAARGPALPGARPAQGGRRLAARRACAPRTAAPRSRRAPTSTTSPPRRCRRASTRPAPRSTPTADRCWPTSTATATSTSSCRGCTPRRGSTPTTATATSRTSPPPGASRSTRCARGPTAASSSTSTPTAPSTWWSASSARACACSATRAASSARSPARSRWRAPASGSRWPRPTTTATG